jgi:hypothetical protein
LADAVLWRPFQIDSQVEWNLYAEADHDWLDAVLGQELPAEVTHGEDHHDSAPGPTALSKCTVRRIRAVSSVYGPLQDDPSAKVLVPVLGTAQLYDVTNADGWFPDDGRLTFNGYLVDLELS